MEQTDWHQTGLIPQLLYFQNGNEYMGSSDSKGGNELRFKIKPDGDKIVVELWPGPYCYEKSEVADRAEFPMDEDGRSQSLDWLNEKYNRE